MNDYYILLQKNEIEKLNIKIDSVELKKIKFNVKKNKIKEILSFWK